MAESPYANALKCKSKEKGRLLVLFTLGLIFCDFGRLCFGLFLGLLGLCGDLDFVRLGLGVSVELLAVAPFGDADGEHHIAFLTVYDDRVADLAAPDSEDIAVRVCEYTHKGLDRAFAEYILIFSTKHLNHLPF